MKKKVLFSIMLSLIVSSLFTVAVSADSGAVEFDALDGDIISDEEAYNNFIELFGYSEEEAYEATYGNSSDEFSAASTSSSVWRTVSHNAENATVTGQYQTSGSWIVDCAPITSIEPDSGVNIQDTDYSTLTCISEDTMRMESRYEVYLDSSLFSFWEDFDVYKYH